MTIRIGGWIALAVGVCFVIWAVTADDFVSTKTLAFRYACATLFISGGFIAIAMA